MTRFLTVAGCASALALAASAALADPSPTPTTVAPAAVKAPPATAAASPKDSEIVCFKEEQTGTRLGAHRVCMTRAQAAQRSQDAKQVLDDSRGRLSSSPQ